MNEDRLVEIETKIAFQENTIIDLSDTFYYQQKQIDTLTRSRIHPSYPLEET
ncbi:MAG: SlyX family protein [Candidatus Mariimomonas ferrooxydans]